ncbi:hypothetical protein SAMN04488128_102155 [Chitinophaga eiseniae]|uniref:Uncharacterized protein n=1 Tax=Chitinophaga eiseniae TaxID=634771 RepID=A0A1T4Q4E9_9BACT|nr:hypothetical protein SAMN04488128_102155 [Chitinophaga eiseniae]
MSVFERFERASKEKEIQFAAVSPFLLKQSGMDYNTLYTGYRMYSGSA